MSTERARVRCICGKEILAENWANHLLREGKHRAAWQACSICGDAEPFHAHHEGQRIEDYFTVGRGQTDFEAALAWKERYQKLRSELAR